METEYSTDADYTKLNTWPPVSAFMQRCAYHILNVTGYTKNGCDGFCLIHKTIQEQIIGKLIYIP